MKVTLTTKGDFKNTKKFFESMKRRDYLKQLDSLGQDGVEALRSATPVDSGVTANSWNYEVINNGRNVEIVWTNTNTVSGVNIAIILQYGHGTGTGGFVAGRDYINPAIKPVMDKIADSVWKVVTSA